MITIGNIVEYLKFVVGYGTALLTSLEDILSEPTSKPIIRIIDEDSTLTTELPKDFMGGINKKNEGGKNMPPKYADGSIRQRANGVFEYRFMFNNEQTSVYGKTIDICYQKRTELLEGKRKPKNVKDTPKINKNISYYKYLIDWVKIFKRPPEISEGQVKKILSIIEQKIKPELGSVSIGQLTAQDFKSLLNKYSDLPNAQYKLHLVLQESMRTAKDIGYIKINPYATINFRKREVNHYAVLQFDEQNAILEAITVEKYRLAFMLCCCTGVRIGELIQSIPYVDFETNHFVVVNKDTRNKKHQRRIPFLPELLTPEKQKLLMDIKIYSTEKYFRRLFRKLGIKNAVPHSFRHTFISVCGYLKIDPAQIQAWSGHRHLSTTLNTYTHLLKKGTSPILSYLSKLKEEMGL